MPLKKETHIFNDCLYELLLCVGECVCMNACEGVVCVYV